jgi:hypothetical protein
MRNILLSLGAGALLCVATSMSAGAAPLSAPAGARAALQDLGGWNRYTASPASFMVIVGVGEPGVTGRARTSMAVGAL